MHKVCRQRHRFAHRAWQRPSGRAGATMPQAQSFLLKRQQGVGMRTCPAWVTSAAASSQVTQKDLVVLALSLTCLMFGILLWRISALDMLGAAQRFRAQFRPIIIEHEASAPTSFQASSRRCGQCDHCPIEGRFDDSSSFLWLLVWPRVPVRPECAPPAVLLASVARGRSSPIGGG